MRYVKCQTIVDKEHDEEVLIYVHEKNELSEAIEEMVLGYPKQILGYNERGVVNLSTSEVSCFAVYDGRVYAICDRERLQVKQRLYVLEEMLGDDFVKINQSCIANIGKIARFDTSFAGSLMVIFKNGYKDYVSRRQLKNVKERIGF